MNRPTGDQNGARPIGPHRDADSPTGDGPDGDGPDGDGPDGDGPDGDGAAADIDPDVGSQDRAPQPTGGSPVLLATIAAGGILGAEARYGLGLALPHRDGQFPWSTLVINLTGCLLIGVLMTVLLGMRSPHRLLRPFLGVGILGGYTTYSGFAVETQRLVLQHRPLVAVAYAASTVLACAVAVWLASAATAAALAGRLSSEHR